MGLEPLKQEAGSEQSWSIMFLWVSCSWEEKNRTQGCSVGSRKGWWPRMLCIYVMSQVPGTSGYIIVNFICGYLYDSWEVLGEEEKGSSQELQGGGL